VEKQLANDCITLALNDGILASQHLIATDAEQKAKISNYNKSTIDVEMSETSEIDNIDDVNQDDISITTDKRLENERLANA